MSARKVTADLIHSKIKSVVYFNAGAANTTPVTEDVQRELSLITHCVIVLQNGFKVEGTSACVDPASYNEAIGQDLAFQAAFEKIWPLEGYLLKEQMYQEQETADMLADLNEGDCDGCKI